MARTTCPHCTYNFRLADDIDCKLLSLLQEARDVIDSIGCVSSATRQLRANRLIERIDAVLLCQ